MAKNQPKIAEVRSETCKRIEKCSSLDLEILDQILEILEYLRRAKMRNTVCEYDRAMANRWFLLYATLHCHDDDADAALSRFQLLERIRIENELRKGGKTA